jgi:hypothetical protein
MNMSYKRRHTPPAGSRWCSQLAGLITAPSGQVRWGVILTLLLIGNMVLAIIVTLVVKWVIG